LNGTTARDFSCTVPPKEDIILKQVLYDIAKTIVNNPDRVNITERLDGDTVIFNLMVDEADLGKVIGKQGRIAKAIRTVVKAVANRDGKRCIVDISENLD